MEWFVEPEEERLRRGFRYSVRRFMGSLTPLMIITMALIATLIATEAIFHWSVRGKVIDLGVGDRHAVVLSAPKPRAHSWSAPVLVHGVGNIQLTVMYADSLHTTPHTGDTLLFHSTITPPIDTHNPGSMDYGTWLRRHGIHGVAFCYAGNWRVVGEGRIPLRERLSAYYARYFNDASLGIVSAMTLGDRTLLDDATREDFSLAGASHVLALSGLHLGILVAIFTLCVLRWVRQWRVLKVVVVLAGLSLMACYVLMAGAPPSLVRASLMLVAAMLSGIWERSGLSLNNVALAALLLLLWNPCTLFDLGFQLSFVAVVAIVIAVNHVPFPAYISRRMPSRGELVEQARFEIAHRLHIEALEAAMKVGTPKSAKEAQKLSVLSFLPEGLKWCEYPLQRLRVEARVVLQEGVRMFWTMTVVSLAAQLATMPLVACNFHNVPLYGVLLNLVLTPLVYGVLTLSVLFFLTAWCMPLQSVVVAMQTICLTLLASFVGWVAELPGSHLTLSADKKPAMCIYHSFSTPQIECQQGVWQGNVMHSPYGRVARIDTRIPEGVPQKPLQVNYLWLCRGAKGHLSQWLQLYNPDIVVLDASLSDFYYTRFSLETKELRLTVHDIRRQGALIIK